jgi:hypothetical protein
MELEAIRIQMNSLPLEIDLTFLQVCGPTSSHLRFLCARSISCLVGATRHCIQLLLAASNNVLKALMPRWDQSFIFLEVLHDPVNVVAMPWSKS